MALRRTLDFLPSIFQTDTNRKFLSATLDQLVSEPDFTRVNGYIGRKFAPTYKTGDSYIPEVSDDRRDYQLEPSLVVKNSSNEVEFYSSYSDLINKISYYGGATANHDRLFASEQYSFTGLFDLDKFVNYQQYYWLPNGPTPIQIASPFVTKQATYLLSKDAIGNCYRIAAKSGDNPEILLVRGGLYKFAVNQPGSKFYIQTEPGISGTRRVLPTVSSREVYGVTGNGTDSGVVEFRVPLINAQDKYLKMPMQRPVDYAVDTAFSHIAGAVWSDVVANYGGLDGVDVDPSSKLIIFLNDSDADADWTHADGSIVPAEHRRGVWRMQLNQGVINLVYIRDINTNNRVYARLGRINANYEFFKDVAGQLLPVPSLTAQSDILYYQDATNPDMHGTIRIVNEATDNIHIDTSILGKKNYTSPAGVDFTNGLVVAFDGNVEPARYANKTYIVEGVGRGIRLVEFGVLVFPESYVKIDTIPWDTQNFSTDNYDEPYKGPAVPEYLTVNRSSLEGSAWARHNRWFHIDVLLKAAEYNGETATFNQAIRAQRPIIEFEPDLQFINSGRIAKRPVDHIDTFTTDAFNQVQHSQNLIVDGTVLNQGDRILFANDKDPLVKSQIYKVQYKIQDELSYRSIYDGTGTGTISIDMPKLNYYSGTAPVLVSDVDGQYTYLWTVVGRPDLLTATQVRGFNWPDLSSLGVVNEVTDLGIGQYQVEFVTTFLITEVISSGVSIIGPGGTVTVVGTGTQFEQELRVGAALYTTDDQYLGIVEAITENDRVQLTVPSLLAVTDIAFNYKDPRIQLQISEDELDALEPFDTVVATSGDNKGQMFWYTGTEWLPSQTPTKSNQAPLFDTFDNTDASFAGYNSSKFFGTNIFSYKAGAGVNDKILGFPISYTNVGTVTNTSIADITFTNNYSTDTFDYLAGTTFKNLNIDTGYIRQNIGRNEFVKRNIWSTVNEPSRQHQIISKTYTGKTNYFEIDVAPDAVTETPTLRVFLNNVLLNPTQYVPNAKFGKRTAVKITASLLTIGDKVDILLYSKSTSKLAHYQIPTNLDYNSKNEEFSTVTLGQLRNNLVTVGQNIPALVGSIPGDSNIRDLDSRTYGGNILQNSASVIYSSLFLINEQANLMSSIDYARREYTKFKNKFVELCTSLPGLDINDAKSGVDEILLSINSVKNKSFPWYYSDMVPYGKYDVINYTVLNTNQRQYKINNIFNDTVLQSRAVLVYYNGHQLIKDQDFTFDQTRPAVQLVESFVTTTNAVIEIREYTSTDSNFIPETPTKLGLYPKFLPVIELDTTYRTPTDVIQGHDGSITPAFGDFRDQYLLELELRIYNNIKVDTTKNIMDVRTLVPGRFRNTAYSLTEFNKIINTHFLKWVGANKLDYIANTFFVGNDPFSYNYRYSKDILFNENLPGYWKGIYQYFYDTEKPHSHPWEMLGFTEEPAWWEDEYGPAPYTSGNSILWEDLEAGMIRRGNTAGVDVKFARPGLSKIVPVDSAGDLVAPIAHIAAQFSSINAGESFQLGDVGPVESAWRRTSEFPYALQAAAALMKPGIYFGTLMDTNNYYRRPDYQQYVDLRTNGRVTPTTIAINGETVGATVTRSTGYINWIVDYLTSLGIVGTSKVRTLLDNLEVQLSYKVAGYTDKKYITVLAEQYSPSSTNESVIIPDDSYTIHLNKSVPTERVAYSAVIVEKTDTGFAVSGYNTANPYFIVVPSETAGESYNITVDTVTGTIYKGYKRQKLALPYGTEFKTRQQVVDFLVSYQRFLFAQGFIFDEYDSDLAQVQDWVLSAREFLTWTLQGWKAGSVIVLSPVNSTLKLITTNAVVDQITNSASGSRILDPSFGAIRTTDITVLRDAGEFKLTTINNKTIAFADLNLVQYEHVMIFNNTTVFSDVIYKPETGSRQYRLKLVGNKTDNWDGSLNPAGFVYNNTQIDAWKAGRDNLKGDIVSYKNQYYVATQKVFASTVFDLNQWKQIDKSSVKTGLLPNFSNNASRFIDIYDVDSSLLDSQMARMSSGLIGFRTRNYLNDLNINHTSQTKFYQGYITQKGTKSAVTNLLNATFNDLSNDVSYSEEWAVRVGEYGATESNRVVEIVLDETVNKSNPTAMTIIADTDVAPIGIVGVHNRDLWARTFAPGAIKFINRKLNAVSENDIQTAGYVNTADVDTTLFDSSDYQLLDGAIDDISSGYLVWVAKDQNKDWNIYRTTETDTSVSKISYGLGTVGKVTTSTAHKLTANQTIVIKDFDARFDGFYTIGSITGTDTFTIQLTAAQTDTIKLRDITETGTLFALNSVRFKNPGDIANFVPKHGWKDGDLVWVDTNESNNWAVYEKNSVWNYNTTLDMQFSGYTSNLHYGTSVKIDNNDKFVIVGAPGDASGAGRIYAFNKTGPKEKGILSGDLSGITSLGHCVDMAQTTVVAGAPTSYASSGAVVVYRYRQSTFFAPTQVLVNPLSSVGAKFGTSITLSEDAKYLYVGAPGASSVFFYKHQEYNDRRTLFNVFDAINGCVMPYAVGDIYSLAVYLHGKLLTLNTDYFWNAVSNKITFAEGIPASFILEDGVEFISEDGLTLLGNEFNIGEPGSIVVLQRGYYKLEKTITTNNVLDEFGISVKSSLDGQQLVVGAPGAVVNDLIQSGKTYIFANNMSDTAPDWNQIQVVTATNPVYRGRFGSSVDICRNSCSVYIGQPGYSDLNYNGGLVERWVNIGKLFGSLTGNVQNPVVTIGHSIIVNDTTVTFTGSTLSSVITDINAARIIGVTAKAENNKLRLDSIIEIDFNRLTIIPGTGTALIDLGLMIMGNAQVIKKPVDTQCENFGSVVKIGRDATTLAVASTLGNAVTYASVDKKKTTFDSKTTIFIDVEIGTGSMFFHNFMPNAPTSEYRFGNFVFSEQFNAPSLHKGDQFGCSIDFTDTDMYIGASYNDTQQNNAGEVYQYLNPTGARGWTIKREQLPSVDVYSINSVSLYNKKTKSKLVTLDYIDPIKGKSLGIAAQSLNYQSSRDPAMYNAGSSIADGTLIDFHWGTSQVGQTWWNLDTVRFVDYEQDSLVYRVNNWGRIFPGSTISVYEWVESAGLPSAYTASGTPMHPDDSAYVELGYVDTETGIIKTKYYFWVSGITTVADTSTRQLSVVAIENALRNPIGQNIPYAAIISDNSLALYNCDQYVSGNDIILKVDYDHVSNDNLIHSEFDLVAEGSKDAVMPARIVNKLVDSLAGVDNQERRVPDAKLKSSQSIGLEMRPRQTLVTDRYTALKNVVEFVNTAFSNTTAAYKLQNSAKYADALFFGTDPEPMSSEYQHRVADLTEREYVIKTPGERTLVASDANFANLWTLYQVLDDGTWELVKNQTFKTPDLWEYIDWYKSDYNAETKPTYIVEHFKDTEKLTLVAGNTVKVNQSATGGFEVYRYTSKDTADLVAVENGTIKLRDTIWNIELSNVGFDTGTFEEVGFDRDYSKELRHVLQGLEQDMFVDDLLANYNQFLFVIINYIMSEQQNVDWIFKTSFVTVLHKIKELKQYPNFIRDNHNYYEEYINEVKPYRTKIREYKIGYTGTDYAYAHTSDFDLPGYFDIEENRFRSPDGSDPTKDGELFLQSEYKDWAQNFTFGVDFISIATPGYGFTTTPVVQIVANGDGGVGATAIASIDNVTGVVTQITVTNSGTGYKSTPHVIINGDGTGARAYARLSNNKVRGIKTTMKFDRIAYTTAVREWIAGIVYQVNDLVSYRGCGYICTTAGASNVFVLGNFRALIGSDYNTANDRIAATYAPGPNQIPKTFDAVGNIDLTRLIPGISYEYNIVTNDPNVYNDNTTGGNGTGTDLIEIDIVGGAFYDVTKSFAPEELVPGVSSDSLSLRVETIVDNSRYIYKINKDNQNNTSYFVVSANKTTTLAADLAYSDTKVYISDFGSIALPQLALKNPGVIYVNGEQIKFWTYNLAGGFISNPIRGANGTGIPLLHPAGSVVEDQSHYRKVPETTTISEATFIFTKKEPIFAPAFIVSSDINIVRNLLEVRNGYTKLLIDVDYTISITNYNGYSKVTITFVNAGAFADGIRIDAKYVEDRIWLNPGINTVTDGTGLAGSEQPAALLVKQNPHNLP